MRTVIFSLAFICAVAAIPIAAIGALLCLVGIWLDDAAEALHIYANPAIRREYEKE